MRPLPPSATLDRRFTMTRPLYRDLRLPLKSSSCSIYFIVKKNRKRSARAGRKSSKQIPVGKFKHSVGRWSRASARRRRRPMAREDIASASYWSCERCSIVAFASQFLLFSLSYCSSLRTHIKITTFVCMSYDRDRVLFEENVWNKNCYANRYAVLPISLLRNVRSIISSSYSLIAFYKYSTQIKRIRACDNPEGRSKLYL